MMKTKEHNSKHNVHDSLKSEGLGDILVIVTFVWLDEKLIAAH